MIKHIVMWRLKDEAEGGSKEANALKIKEILEGLEGQIPGLLKIEVGLDFLHSEQSYDVVLYSELESRDALEAYRVHPLHKEAAVFIGAVQNSRAVVDYEV